MTNVYTQFTLIEELDETQDITEYLDTLNFIPDEDSSYTGDDFEELNFNY